MPPTRALAAGFCQRLAACGWNLEPDPKPE